MKTKRTFKMMMMLSACLMIWHGSKAQNWQLVWQDEFTNGISPDWVFETGTGSGGWGNNELQYYRQQNATVENGQLVITARRENYGGMNYTSARMKTQGRKSWKYGRIEARIQMPSFTGSWPAFWMLGDNITSVGWPACGEIDIMEHVNTEAQTHGTIHWQDHNNSYASYSGSTGVNVTAYHVYAIEWSDSYIRWFVDGNLYHEASIAGGVNGTQEFHNNFFILLNMAIGGNWPGFTVDNNAFPARMLVDYVRVYQANTGGGNTGVATLYQHCNYGGYAVALPEGNYTLAQLQARGVADNDISSIRVQSGYRATLYQNNNFTGSSLIRTADDDCLVNEGFNDVITSVSIAPVSSGFSTQIEAENFTTMNGVQTEACSEGGQNVGWIDAGDWMVWDVNLPSSGTYNVQYRVSSPNNGGVIQLEKAGGSPVYGTISVPNTGGWQNWTTISHNVSLSAGQQQIAIYVPTGGWNINWLKISSSSGARLDQNEPHTVLNLSLFPNPVADRLVVKGLEGSEAYTIVDLSGKSVVHGIVSPGDQINVSQLKSGPYIIKLNAGNTLKFIKK